MTDGVTDKEFKANYERGGKTVRGLAEHRLLTDC